MSTILCAYGCNQPAKFFNPKQIGRCSYRPSMCEGIRARAKEAIKKKYASKSPEEKESIKVKRGHTNMSRYGVTNVSSSDDVKSKRTQTFLYRFGVVNPSYNPEILNKIIDKVPLVLEKRKTTNIKKYGSESYSSTDEFKERRKETWLAKYGVDNPAKDPDIKDKIMAGQDHRRTNKFITLNGDKVRVQGNEDKVIKDLIKSGIKEDEIICDRKRIPKIPYNIDGKNRIYYPDIYLPRFNLLIEVKSIYTWQKYKSVNLAKIDAAKKAGYQIRVVVR